MGQEKKNKNIVLIVVCLCFAAFFALWEFSSTSVLSLTCTRAKTPKELLSFLESRRQDVQCIKVNRHLLEIGKRPSLQIVAGYEKVMYQLRPYRQIQFKFRNFTVAEVMDLCTNITSSGLENLRTAVASGKGYQPAWQGAIKGSKLTLVRVTHFTYLVDGLADKPLFMGQVELAKRIGMDDSTVLELIIPAQERWLERFKSSPSFDSPYPARFLESPCDGLIGWLGGPIN